MLRASVRHRNGKNFASATPYSGRFKVEQGETKDLPAVTRGTRSVKQSVIAHSLTVRV